VNDRYYLNFTRIAAVTLPLRAWTDCPFRELGDVGDEARIRPVLVTGHDTNKRVYLTVLDGYEHDIEKPVLESSASIYRVWVESEGMMETPLSPNPVERLRDAIRAVAESHGPWKALWEVTNELRPYLEAERDAAEKPKQPRGKKQT